MVPKLKEYNYESTVTGIHAYKKGVGTMKHKKRHIDDMDQAFPDGIFTSPNSKSLNLRFRDMDKWCQEHGRSPESLTDEELEQFRV